MFSHPARFHIRHHSCTEMILLCSCNCENNQMSRQRIHRHLQHITRVVIYSKCSEVQLSFSPENVHVIFIEICGTGIHNIQMQHILHYTKFQYTYSRSLNIDVMVGLHHLSKLNLNLSISQSNVD
jgi:hypothetical protein